MPAPTAPRTTHSVPFRMVSTPLVRWLVVALAALAAPVHAASERLGEVQALLDQGEAAKALELLERAIRGKPDAAELLLRGTARIMLGEIAPGAADLERAVALDPSLRQAWMNLAGLEIAEAKYEKALGLLKKAHDLDPDAPDGHLNLGAVLVLLGRRAEAKTHFDRYLDLSRGSAEAHYLVAVNYALGGLQHLAIEALSKAITLDEHMRLRARQDDRFLGMDSLEYRVLLHTDDYVLPADHHQVAAAFRTSYEMRESRLLYSLLDSLRDASVGYSPEIETTARWAIVWGDGIRVKVYNQDNGTGVVSISGPKERFPEADWHRMTQEIFRSIHRNLGE